MCKKMFVEVSPFDGDSAAKAGAEITFETEFGDLTISRFKIIHQDGKNAWVAFPNIRYQDEKSGEYRTLQIIIPSRRLRRIITDQILSKYREITANGSQN